MDWWIIFVLFIGGLVFLLISGFPIAFAFLGMDLLGSLFLMGPQGFFQIPLQVYSSLSTFTLSPIPLFILMGELMFHSGVAYRTIDVLDKWLGRLPGRLSLLAAAGGTLFSALSGSTLANTAMLGTVLLPDMQKRGYKPAMSVGPIVGVGGLAMLIPPSSLAVVLAALGHIAVGKILLAGVIPGLLLGGMFAFYIILRCWLNPDLAPRYEVTTASWPERIILLVRYVFPLGIVIFMVLGLMLLGVATPTEAAASGVFGTIVVVAFFKKLTLKAIKNSLIGTLEITIMIFMIIAASNSFSAILSFSGATQGLLEVIKTVELSPILILIGMQLMVFLLGMFMETISIMMICLPIFMPIVKLLGFNPVWFGVIMLINFEMGLITPPFGMLLFVMKGVAPKEISIEAICWAALPFIICDALVMALIIAVPKIALWLPALVR